MSRTGISWTDFTWNYWAGCSIHSPGCSNCYAMAMAARIERFGSAPHYQGTTRIAANGKATWTGKLALASPAQQRKPLTMRQPALWFTNSMSDWLHADAPDQWRLDMLDIMRACPQHQFQVLTKRPENYAPFLERSGATLPANFWAGCTVERADYLHRIDTLRAVPARIRFLSIEPLLGPLGQLDLGGIHWAIIGGESGPGARSCRAEWISDIIRQCQAQGAAVWFKQYGQARNNPLFDIGGAALVAREDPHEKGGSTIDGRRWQQFPTY